MQFATLRFYAELNDHLAPPMRGRDIRHPCEDARENAGNILTMYGVPADEVDLILLNGTPVSLTATVSSGDRLSFYPVFESFDIRVLAVIHGVPLRKPKFVLDVHLGKLASFLRLFGFDAAYRTGMTDADLVEISMSDQRALLSKDRALLENPILTRKYRVLSDDPKEQLAEVLRRFDLASSVLPFSRCLRCNTILERVEKDAVAPRLLPKVVEFYDEFYACRSCDRIYWKGSHYQRMKEFIEKTIHNSGRDQGQG